jgi:hypothetical protein
MISKISKKRNTREKNKQERKKERKGNNKCQELVEMGW